MALKTRAQLQTAANVIATETGAGANTCARVGGLFDDFADSIPLPAPVDATDDSRAMYAYGGAVCYSTGVYMGAAYIGIGLTNPPTSGAVRLAANQSITGWANAATAAILTQSTNNLQLGATTWNYVDAKCGGSYALRYYVGATLALTVDASGLNAALPVILTQHAAPASVNGGTAVQWLDTTTGAVTTQKGNAKELRIIADGIRTLADTGMTALFSLVIPDLTMASGEIVLTVTDLWTNSTGIRAENHFHVRRNDACTGCEVYSVFDANWTVIGTAGDASADYEVVVATNTLSVNAKNSGGHSDQYFVVELVGQMRTVSDVPAIVSAETNAGGTNIVWTYDSYLDSGSTPAVGAFTLTGCAACAIASLVVAGKTVTFSFTGTIVSTDGPLMTYTGGANKLRESATHLLCPNIADPMFIVNNVPA